MNQIYLILCLWALPLIIVGQDKEVTGKVISEDDGIGLPGVNIIIQGTNIGTVSDVEGNFKINASPGDVLVFSSVGYVKERIPVGDKSYIKLSMIPDIQSLEEVVVIGYGTQKKSDLTGSVTSVRGEDLSKIPASNPLQALQGKVAGAQISNTTGEPGKDPTVRVRGVGTLNNANPIYVVDGVILDDISFLNTSDIYSIEMLKDASATAIYGSRGANGVFVITTKEGGKNTEPQIRLQSEVSVQRLQKKLDLLNGREFAEAVNEINPGTFNNLDALPDVDWQDEIFRDNPILQSYNLSVSGGSEKLSYYLGGGVFNQKGIIPKSDFTRYSFKLNTSYDAKDYLTLGTNVTAAFIEDLASPNVVYTAYGAWPIDEPYDEEGDFAEVRGTANPLGGIEFTNNEAKKYRLISNTYAEFSFLKNFTFKTSYQTDLLFGKNRSFSPVYFVSPVQQNDQEKLRARYLQENLWIWENTLNFNKEIDKHSVDVLAGLTFQERNKESPQFTATDLIRSEEDFWYFNASLRDSVQWDLGSGDLFKTSLLSYIFRVNYTFDNRYLFTGTLRIDGSSKFSEENRYGNFPSLAVGWNISNESFFPDVTYLNRLKLRGSWGIIGNEKIGWQDRFSLIANNAIAVFGDNERTVQGSTFGSPGNPFIKWESTIQTNVGLELMLFEGKLAGEVDFYNKRTEDILVNLSPPGYVGEGAFVKTRFNAADVVNKGIEFNLSWENTVGDFNYGLSVLGSTVKNEVKSLGAAIPADSVIRAGSILGNQVTVTTPGHPIGAFSGYEVQGIFQNEEDLNTYPNLGSQDVGDLIFRDANGDGEVNADDRVIIGSPVPDFIYGFGLNLDYKGLGLSLDFQGQVGNEIYNGKNQNRFTLLNFEGRVRDRWSGEGTSNSEPRLTSQAGNYPPSEYYIEDGSFMRLRSATLSYQLPEDINKAIGFMNTMVYLKGTNIFTLTEYSGYSPEIGGDPLESGIDRGVYPITSIYSIGLNASF